MADSTVSAGLTPAELPTHPLTHLISTFLIVNSYLSHFSVLVLQVAAALAASPLSLHPPQASVWRLLTLLLWSSTSSSSWWLASGWEDLFVCCCCCCWVFRYSPFTHGAHGLCQQSSVRANRSTVGGYFLAGRSMTWWPVSHSFLYRLWSKLKSLIFSMGFGAVMFVMAACRYLSVCSRPHTVGQWGQNPGHWLVWLIQGCRSCSQLLLFVFLHLFP